MSNELEKGTIFVVEDIKDTDAYCTIRGELVGKKMVVTGGLKKWTTGEKELLGWWFGEVVEADDPQSVIVFHAVKIKDIEEVNDDGVNV